MEEKIIFDGLLKVLSNGDVYKLTDGQYVKMKTSLTSRNKKYKAISITQKGKQKHYYIHRLVAEAFIPNPNNYPMVNHIDGNSLNNNVDNLEWCTAQQNTIHAYKLGLINHMSRFMPCEQCGNPTAAKDGICADCKEKIKKDIRHEIRIQNIKDELSNINREVCTKSQLNFIEMRLQGYTYSKIAEKFCVSKQYVAQEIDKAIVRSTAPFKINVTVQREIETLIRRIERKKRKHKQLLSEIHLVESEINALESVVSDIKISNEIKPA